LKFLILRGVDIDLLSIGLLYFYWHPPKIEFLPYMVSEVSDVGGGEGLRHIGLNLYLGVVIWDKDGIFYTDGFS